jgi:peptidoglycan/LPS O-acetylase OafA/YrhL
MESVGRRPDTPNLTVHSTRRLPELDGVRGLACLTVLIWHYVFVPLDLGRGPLSARFPALVILGPSGVDLFFVLSGFLIGGILFDNRHSPSYFRTFYVRRVCRIFPVYYVMVISFVIGSALIPTGTACDLWLLKDPMPTYSYATFSQNFYMSGAGTAGAKWMAMSWSVAVEEQFYMLFPLVVWLVPRGRMCYLVLGAIVAAPVLRVLTDGRGVWYYTLLPCRVDALAVGVLAAHAVRQRVALSWLRANRSALYFGMVTCGLGFAFFRANHLGYTWLALLFAQFILLVVIHPDTMIAAVCRNAALRWLGLISYGLYMYHQVVNGLFHSVLLSQAPAIRNWVGAGVTLLSAGALLSLAVLSYYGMEKRLLQLGHRSRWFPRVETGETGGPALPALSRVA